jgi:PDZ domain/Aspartyl protease
MMRKSMLLLCACAAAFSTTGRPAAAAPLAGALLSSLRSATLGRPLSSISSIHVTARIELLGLHGSSQEWDDPRHLRFVSSQDAGPLSGSNGWDGSVAWSRDYAGMVTIDGGMPGRLQAIDEAYLDNFGYLQPDAGGALVVYAGNRADGAKSYDVLAVTPARGTEIDLWIDPKTHLIARETGTIGNISATTTLADYHRVDGLTYPFFSSTSVSNGNKVVTNAESLELNGRLDERLRVPAQNAHDFTIAGAQSTTVPLEIVNNHIYLQVRLNGRGPYRFVLDSGGDYIVTPEVAAALAVQSSGGVQLQGAGSGSESAAFTRIAALDVGGATVRSQYMLVLPIATGFGMAEGMRIDGMLGYQFLSRFLTTIDYASSKLTLTMPAAAPAAPAGAAVIPFYIDGAIPRIAVSLDGVSADAEVDTGNRAAVTLSAPFVNAHPAIAALQRTAPGVAGFGVGGPAVARLGRIGMLQIGPFTMSNVIASFDVQTQGAFASPFNPANIGGAIWRRFVVTLDYGHKRMLLTKNDAFATPFSYDRSGLFIIQSKGAYTIISAFPGSPAAAAGLAKGDVILAVNGSPAGGTSLADLRTLLSGTSGSVVRLRVHNSAGDRDVALTLRDYV